ncbi:hypothetical protein [Polynucleobacter hirudinilacicola]|nr:hypothetical protein [Polynucleobacter hirudinilacicola]
MKQFLRRLRGKKAYETHNIGNALNLMLDLKNLLPSREDLEKKIAQRKIKVLELPRLQIDIPSNEQCDDKVYQEIDRFIQNNPDSNIAFKISQNLSGDYEYASTKAWFLNAYSKARESYPIPLLFSPNKLNIALHIRRGDLLPGRQFSDLSSRMLPDAWYLEVLNTILSNLPGLVAIHIYSEGKDGRYCSEAGVPFSWKEYFQNSGHEIHEYIDGDFMGTFHHLLHADLLIGSKSGMSHLAGMLGNQVKLMPEMWHSYRGANKLLELPSSQTEIDRQALANHIKLHLG